MPASKPKAKKENLFCITHPTRRARRRCYFCRRPLCPRCQFRFSGHIFCGALCHNRYLRGVRRERWRKTAARIAAHPAARWTAMGLALAVLAVTTYLSLAVLRSSELYAKDEPAAVPVMPERRSYMRKKFWTVIVARVCVSISILTFSLASTA